MNNRLIGGLLVVVALIIIAVLIAVFAGAVPFFSSNTETQVVQPQQNLVQGQVQGAYTTVNPYQAYQDADGNYRGGQTIYGYPAGSPYATTNVTSYPGPGAYTSPYASTNVTSYPGTRTYYQYQAPTQYRYQYTQPAPQPQPAPVVCTQDAMQCPDGSYVGRVAPSCQFAACPR